MDERAANPMTSDARRILVVTDSLGFPRAEPELVRYDQTWIALLKQAFPDLDFIHHGLGGGDIYQLLNHVSYFSQTLDPCLTLVQCGVVDCAPRALTRVEGMVLRHVKPVRLIVEPLLRRNLKRLRKWRKIRYTSPERFELGVQQFEQTFKQVLWIGITPGSPQWEAEVAGITDSISAYNTILGVRDFISVESLSAADMMSDHHHLNAEGHRKLFTLVRSRISEILEAKELRS